MWNLKIILVLFIVLQNHAGNSFYEFTQGEALYSSMKETLSTMLFDGVSDKCNQTFRRLDDISRWKCKLCVQYIEYSAQIV
jgi:hypothetical protein